MNKIIAFLISLFVCQGAWAGGYDDEISDFFELYESGKVVEAIDRIYSTNPWISGTSDAVMKVKNRMSGLNSLVGDYLGKEKLGEQNVGDRMVHVTYLALYQRQPVRMEFQFYRPRGDWIIYGYSYDDNIDDELEKAAREAIVRGDAN